MREETMKCPFCDFDSVHIEAVRVNRGGEVTIVTKDGTKLKIEGADGRGGTVEVVFWCESGHKWVRRFHFHKGSVSVCDDLLISDLEQTFFPYVSDLWRD